MKLCATLGRSHCAKCTRVSVCHGLRTFICHWQELPLVNWDPHILALLINIFAFQPQNILYCTHTHTQSEGERWRQLKVCFTQGWTLKQAYPRVRNDPSSPTKMPTIAYIAFNAVSPITLCTAVHISHYSLCDIRHLVTWGSNDCVTTPWANLCSI